MERGTCLAPVHGVAKAGHDLVIKQQQQIFILKYFTYT